MTNEAYILSQIGFQPGNSDTIEAALLDVGLTKLGTYTVPPAGEVNLARQAMIPVIKTILTTADTSSSAGETQSSKKYDRGSLLKMLADLEEEVGDITAIPTISSRPWW